MGRFRAPTGVRGAGVRLGGGEAGSMRRWVLCAEERYALAC